MSNDSPARKRKIDSTFDDMGVLLSKFRKGYDVKTAESSWDTADEEVNPAVSRSPSRDQGDVAKSPEKEAALSPSKSVKSEAKSPEKEDALSPSKSVKSEPAADKIDEHAEEKKPKEEQADGEVGVEPEEQPVGDAVEHQKTARTQSSSSIDDAPPALERQDDDEKPDDELLDDTQECSDASPELSPVRKDVEEEEDDENAGETKKKEDEDDIKVDKVVRKPSLRSANKKTSIADFGYHFNEEGQLRTIEGDGGFKFTTQKEYEELGELIGAYVYELMEAEGLEKKYFEVGRNRRFYFASPGYEDKARVLVLIHGSGVVKAGQWARKLIINESLDRGTQLPYIKRALANGWGVVVINYNESCVGQDGRCHGPDAHGCEEWKHAFAKRRRMEIVVVAHSAGGSIISEVVRRNLRVEDERVVCVALTDSWFSEGRDVYAVNYNTIKKRINRDRSGVYQMYSGDNTHEGTSASCFNACFAILEAVNGDTEEEEFCDLLEMSEKIIINEFTERSRKKREEKGDTASAKSLELAEVKAEIKKALADEKENGDAEKKEKAKGDEAEEVKEDELKTAKEGEAEEEDKEKEVEEQKKAKGDEAEEEDKEKEVEEQKKKVDEKEEEKVEEAEAAPAPAPARAAEASDNEDDSDEGVEKDVSPEKSDAEQ